MTRRSTPVARWRQKLSGVFTRRRFESTLDRELRATVDELAAEHEERGVAPNEARRLALVELGGLDQVKERVRAERSGVWLEQLAQDARYAWRSLCGARGYASVAILTLALGIGGTTAIFSVVRAAAGTPPYPDADRLVHIWATWPGGAGNFGYPDFQLMREENRTFAALAAYEGWGGVALTGIDRPVRLNPNFVTVDYLKMLGARTLVGRLFRADENQPMVGAPVAILSEACWRQHFGGDASVIDRTVSLNNNAYTVIGVIVGDFRDLAMAERGPAPDVWLPAATAPRLLGQPPLTDLYGIYFGVGLLKPGVTLEQAQESLAAVSAEQARRFPAAHADNLLRVQPLVDRLAGPVRRPARLLLAGAGLILLLGCLNLANASLVRLSRRRVEMALRGALGATSARLMQQLLLEAALLAAAGSALGLALAVGLTRVLGAWTNAHVTALVDVRVDGTVLLCAAVLTVLTTVLMGFIPAFEGRRVDLRTELSRGGSRASTGRRALARRSLVVGEIALSMVLLVAAALMAQSVRRLMSSGVGYDPSRLLTFRVDLNGDRYADAPSRVRFSRALDEHLRDVRGVESVSLLGPSMLSDATWVMQIFPAERVPEHATDYLQVFRHSVNPGALTHLRIPLVAGREFTEHDTAETPLVAVISESVAHRLWPGEEAVGKRLRRQDPALPPITVVGVAGDAQHRDRYSLSGLAVGLPPGAVGPQRDLYLSYAQRPNPSITAALRLTAADETSAVTDRVRRAIADLDRDLPVNDVQMLDTRLAAQEEAPAAIAGLFSVFAGFALFLAALGMYGVVAQSVELRAREIGLRLALGAQGGQLLRSIVGGGLVLAIAGTIIGAAGAGAMGRLSAGLLVDVSAFDSATFVSVAATLLAMAAWMSFVPARRVIRKGPMQALR